MAEIVEMPRRPSQAVAIPVPLVAPPPQRPSGTFQAPVAVPQVPRPHAGRSERAEAGEQWIARLLRGGAGLLGLLPVGSRVPALAAAVIPAVVVWAVIGYETWRYDELRHRVLGIIVGVADDRRDDRLDRREPDREAPGMMLDQDADEAFERAEDRAVEHEGAVLLPVFPDVLRPQALGQVRVHLEGAALPLPTDGIGQFEVELRPVEGAFARVDLVVVAHAQDRLFQRGLDHAVHALQVRPRGDLGDDAAEQKFKDVGEAHAVLSDPEQRREYDAIRSMAGGGARFTAGGPGGGAGFEDIFSSMFGGQGGNVRFETGGGAQPDLDDLLRNNDAAYRAACTELTPELWATEPWYNRYVDNVCRLMSAVL